MDTTEKRLLQMPRAGRAKAQGLQYMTAFDRTTDSGQVLSTIWVKRESRRLWFVGASLLKLGPAVKAIEGTS
jgi:hypothetical protein